jgi:hypothetical protein
MGHDVEPIRAQGPEEIRRRRLRAIEELLADVEVRVVDAEEGLAIVERARKPAAVRMVREDLAAAGARHEVLLHARLLIACEGPAEGPAA